MTSRVLPDHIVQVAVIVEGHLPQFMQLDQHQPLAGIIKDLCEPLGIHNLDDFALKHNGSTKQSYITEHNRSDIKKGDVLQLASSPSTTARKIYEGLMDGQQLAPALKQLASLAEDPTFASEFIKSEGFQLIVQMVESDGYTPKSADWKYPITREILAYLLKAFMELMNHGTISWQDIGMKFITVVCKLVSNKKAVLDVVALEYSLEILESIVVHSGDDHYETVHKNVTLQHLIHHLSSQPHYQVHRAALALINAMFQREESVEQKKTAELLRSQQVCQVMRDNVIKTGKPEIAHQLYVLQSLLLNQMEERMNKSIDMNDQTSLKVILELRMAAFDHEIPFGSTINPKRQSGHAADYKKLGFRNHTNPAEDFTQTPPGILALEVMVYFERVQRETYRKIVLENSTRLDEHDCPFVKASMELTKILCEILNIGGTPHEDGQIYYPMFFTHEKPFEELYCICIALLYKTWKEMKAVTDDFETVLGVVREQITRALATLPQTFEEFNQKLSSYDAIAKLWEDRANKKKNSKLEAKPLLDLKTRLKPEIIELIKEQRLRYLVEGTPFLKLNNSGKKVKDKQIFCRLSPNHRVFKYGDCDENTTPTFDQLPNKLLVSDIESLMLDEMITNPQREKKKHSLIPRLSFSIKSADSNQEPINFICTNEYNYCMWTDGINALLGKKMTSEELKKDLDILVGMELDIRLIDVEQGMIPDSPPPIPDEPPDYNFVYDFSGN